MQSKPMAWEALRVTNCSVARHKHEALVTWRKRNGDLQQICLQQALPQQMTRSCTELSEGQGVIAHSTPLGMS
jgi:hypothetical protein